MRWLMIIPLVLLVGCSHYVRTFNFGDDSISELVVPPTWKAAGWTMKKACKTKGGLNWSDEYKVNMCTKSVTSPEATLSWDVAAQPGPQSYAAAMTHMVLQGAALVPAAATLGLTMPGVTVNQSTGAVTQTGPTQTIRTSTTCVGCTTPNGVAP